MAEDVSLGALRPGVRLRGVLPNQVVTLASLSHQLTARYGRGYDRTNLDRMVKFAREFPEEIGATLSHQLSWSHVGELLPLKSAGARACYAGEVAAKRLGVRELRDARKRGRGAGGQEVQTLSAQFGSTPLPGWRADGRQS
jgi:hypothetical protein